MNSRRSHLQNFLGNVFHLGNQFFLADAFAIFCKTVNPVDFFLNIYKLLYEMQFFFIV